jgi:hypothetical protein
MRRLTQPHLIKETTYLHPKPHPSQVINKPWEAGQALADASTLSELLASQILPRVNSARGRVPFSLVTHLP